jgi:ribonucleoside-diphosphate reductase alpha chain
VSRENVFVDEQLLVLKRDGSRVPFQPEKIHIAIEKAFCAEYGLDRSLGANSIQPQLQAVYERVINNVLPQLRAKSGVIDIESIQDIVEQQLMAGGFHNIARSYILYRDERKRARALKQGEAVPKKTLTITDDDGIRRILDIGELRKKLLVASRGVEKECCIESVLEETLCHLYDGAKKSEVNKAMIFAARSRIEKEPAFSLLAARLLLLDLYGEVFSETPVVLENHQELVNKLHYDHFADYIKKGVELERLSPEMLQYDLKRIGQSLKPERDLSFQYLGLQVLYDRYLISHQQRHIEAPQFFWMRVAMGLALNEEDKESRAIEFYNTLSRFLAVSSTPTLFNAGTNHPQLSSCYLSTIDDDLDHIFKVISDNARLSKWAGGLGNDWTPVRARGAIIKGTSGLTQGIIPFLKVANDTAVAVNQGGKRKGAVCAYLETWHLDIEDFLELRKNTGDDRRRTHDMNTANWVPDLFMKRVQMDGMWTLFNPCETEDLHDLYGKAFEDRYVEYEKMAQEGKLRQFKTISAVTLWRKMLTMLFETGHPWITFKDPCNIRSPQRHCGVIHSSNLCTEITLNTSEEETAVCNLASINLAEHLVKKGDKYEIDEQQLAATVRTVMRMLDNVIDINFYPTKEAAAANKLHRPVGLGLMAFQDALYMQRLPYDSQEAVEFADRSMELISYYAILASAELAKEKGPYSSFDGSLWDQGLLPIDTIDLLEKERGMPVKMDRKCHLDWGPVRFAVQQYGMRNSNTMAIAPTATIAHICGVCPSIEPTYSNLFSRSNLSGDFTSLNPYLVEDLKRLKLWDQDLLDELKYYDGSIAAIDRIPDEMKALYKTAFEIDPKWLVDSASRRQKWIDMSISLNIYVKSSQGRVFSVVYQYAWEMGLKTTYYLRTLAATQVEKSTLDVNKLGIQPRWMKSRSASSNIQVKREGEKLACSIADPECESCQ